MWNRLKLSSLALGGRLANLAGLPCVIQTGAYHAPSLDVSVKVRASSRFTIICVNGIDVYFSRLNGAFDGAGISQAGDCTGGETAG